MDYIIAFLYDLWPIAKVFIPAALVWAVGYYFLHRYEDDMIEMRKWRADRLLEAVYTETGRFIAAFKKMPDARQNAIMAFALERERQIVKKGYTFAHDMGHDNEEFAAAASLYAMPPILRTVMSQPVPGMWPWNPESYKPAALDERHRDWVRSGALLLAAMEKEYTFKALPRPDIGALRNQDGSPRSVEITTTMREASVKMHGSMPSPFSEPGSFFSSQNPPYMEAPKPVATMTLTAQKETKQ